MVTFNGTIKAITCSLVIGHLFNAIIVGSVKTRGSFDQSMKKFRKVSETVTLLS